MDLGGIRGTTSRVLPGWFSAVIAGNVVGFTGDAIAAIGYTIVPGASGGIGMDRDVKT